MDGRPRVLVGRRVGATVAYRELRLRTEGEPNMYGVLIT